MVILKSPEEIKYIRKSCKLAASTLNKNIRKYKRGNYYFRVGIAITAVSNEIITNL